MKIHDRQDHLCWIREQDHWKQNQNKLFMTLTELLFDADEPIQSLTIMKPGEKYSIWTREHVGRHWVFNEQTSQFNPETWSCDKWELKKVQNSMRIVLIHLDLEEYPVDTRVVMRREIR